MDFNVIITEYLPSIILIIIGLILGRLDKMRNDKIDAYQSHISAMFTQMITCITANNEGTLALARAMRNGDTNGGLTAAMDKIAKSNENFENFIRELASSNLAKR